jgi:hypothetical protein
MGLGKGIEALPIMVVEITMAAIPPPIFASQRGISKNPDVILTALSKKMGKLSFIIYIQ